MPSCCPHDFIAQVFPSNISSILASFSCNFICYILSYPWRYRINIFFPLGSLCDCCTAIIPTSLYIPHCYLCLCKYFFLQCELFQWEFILSLLHSLVHCLAHTRFSINTNVAVTRPSTFMVYDFILIADFNIDSNTRGQLSNQFFSQTFCLCSLTSFGSRLKIRDHVAPCEDSKAQSLQSCNIVGQVMVTGK